MEDCTIVDILPNLADVAFLWLGFDSCAGGSLCKRSYAVRMARGDIWRCTDADCGCEIHVIVGARAEGPSHPTCARGDAHRKPYVNPSVKLADLKESERLKTIYAMELY